MRLRTVFAVATTLVLGTALASATSCLPGTVATVIAQGACTIGNETFDFSSGYQGDFYDAALPVDFPITADQLSFTPVDANTTSPGFQIGLFPGAISDANHQQSARFNDFISVSTSGGWRITDLPIALNGVVATAPEGSSISEAYYGSGPYNEYEAFNTATPSHYSFIWGPDSPRFSATLDLENATSGTAAAASFVNAQFNFTESPTAVPEPASLALLGSGLLIGAGLLRRKIQP